ncbi:uncharacterized protein [Paramormyrops kingsleyae]
MLGCLRAAVLTCFLWMHLPATELSFTAPPEDLVGLPDGPLVLPCPVYSPNQKGAETVHWERGSGSSLPGPEERIHQLSNGSLFFSRLLEGDFGIYLCQVQDGTDRIRATVRVKKAGMEAVFFSPKSQLVPEGDSVFLQCISGDSRPPAHITWEKDGSPVTKGNQIQGQYGGGSHLKTTGTLYLADVSKDDEGEYICVTHNPLLSIRLQSAAATLTVQAHHATPKIIKGPENITVATDTEASLHCAIQGFPLPMVHWFKNSVPLQNDSRWSFSNSGQLLVFSKVSEEDEGFYHCEARGLKTSVRSQPAYLQTAEMEWSFMQQPVNTTAQAGDSVTLICKPPRSRPPARITWFKNARPLTQKPHFSQLPSGDLLFHRLQEADRGSYFCRASNSLLPRAVSSRKAYLNVQAPPSVMLWPKLVTAVLGSRVTLHCQVSGYPLPRITWSKQGRSVQTGGRVTLGISNATLYFSSVKAYDEGSYTCHATNTIGRAQGTASVRVAVSPVIISFPREVRSSVGVSVVLPCQAVGSSPMRYTWNQGPGHTPISSSSRIRVDEDGMLNITRLERADAGEYHCIAENVAGWDRRTANIIVLAEEDATERGIVSTATLMGCTPFQSLLSNYKCQQNMNISTSTGRTLADRMLVNGSLPEVTTRGTKTAGSIKIHNSSESPGFRSSRLTPEDIWSVVRPRDITDRPAQGPASSSGFVWIPAILSESATAQVTQRDRRVRATPVFSPGSEQALVYEKTASQMTLGLSELGRGHFAPGLPPSFHLQPAELQTPPSEVYSPPAFSHSRSTKNQIPPTFRYSSPNFFHSTLHDNQSPPSYQHTPPTTFQSLSTENQTPPPDLYSPPTTFQSHSTEDQTENQTPPSDLYSPPTTFQSHPTENQTPPPDLYSPPTTFQSHSTEDQTENQTPPPDLYSPPTTFQSHPTENQTPPPNLYSPPTAVQSLSPENQTPPPNLYSPPTAFQSLSTENQTPPPDLYSPPTAFQSLSTENQTPPPDLYSPPTTFQSRSNENQTPPPDLYSPPTTFQSLSTENQTPPPDLYSPPTTFQSLSTENQTPPPDLYSPPTTFQSLSTENQTPPPDLYSPPTTFQSLSTENQTPPPDLYSPPTTFQSLSSKDQTSLPDLYSPPTTFQSLSTENQTPPPDLYSPPTTFQSLSTENQTPPPDLYSPPTTFQSLSTENQTPPPDLYSPPTTFQSLSTENQTPPPDLYSPPTTFQSLSTENQTPPPDLYSPPTTFQSLSTENQTPPPDLYSPSTTFQSLSSKDQTSPPDLYSPPTTFQSRSNENQTPPLDLYSPPTTFQSLSSKDQTSLPDLYSPPTTFQSLSTENQTPPPDLYSPPTTFQSLSTENQTPPPDLYFPPTTFQSLSTENQTPPPDLYSPPTTFQSLSTENQTPPPDLYSPPTTFQSLSTENQTPPPDLYSPPTTFQSLSTENQTPPPDLYSPPTTFQSLSSKDQTSPPDLYSPPTTFQSRSNENQTPPPDLYSPPTTFQSLSTENQTPPPDLYSPPTTFQSLSSKDQTSLPDLYSPPTTFQSLSTENQTPPPDLYSPPTSFQFQSPEASPDYLYIPHVNLLSLAPGLHTSHPVAPTQSTKPLTTSIGPVLSRKDDIISTVPKLQDWNRPTRPDKPSNTELTEWPRKNTSQAPMRTSDDTARVKQHHPLSWFPALEKHDIPIVVGVGVSLTFIFITMAFYSLVQKNDPALAGRGAQRGLGAPCRRGGRLEIRRTYENRAFEDDDFVAVIEQSPDAFGTRAPLPTPGAKTGMTESPGETQPAPASPVPAQLDTEHRNELQMVCRSEREKHPPSPQPNMRLGDSEHWRPCPDPLPLPASPKPLREDGLHTSLTLQTSEAFTTPVSHSVNISHASGPLLLSHCISMGVTTVAVDVHFYPSAPTPPPPPPGSRLADSPESDRVTPSMQCEHRVCL